MSDRPGDCDPLTDVECREVLEEVYLYLDGELTGEGRVVIQHHLDDCGPCLRKFGLERELKALIARCCGHEETPGHLRERVLTSLRSVTVTDGDGLVGTVVTTVTVRETGHDGG